MIIGLHSSEILTVVVTPLYSYTGWRLPENLAIFRCINNKDRAGATLAIDRSVALSRLGMVNVSIFLHPAAVLVDI